MAQGGYVLGGADVNPECDALRSLDEKHGRVRCSRYVRRRLNQEYCLETRHSRHFRVWYSS